MRAMQTERRKEEGKGRKIGLMFFLCLTSIIFLLDRVTKSLILSHFIPRESLVVIDKIFSITYVRNTGGAFGLFAGEAGFFIYLSIVVIILISFYLFFGRERDFYARICLALVLGGAMGNLFDRVFYGYVIDFLDFRIWPVFNLADTAISVGSGLLLLKIFCFRPQNKKAGSGYPCAL